jgi:hypothetical protein
MPVSVRQIPPARDLSDSWLPDDLFDEHDPEQAAIDAGDWNDDLGVFRGETVDGAKRS